MKPCRHTLLALLLTLALSGCSVLVPTAVPSAAVAPAAVATPVPMPPGTPVAEPATPITAASATRVAPLARWGQGWLQAAAWSPDGTRLAVASSTGVTLYDAALRAQDRLEMEAQPTCLAFAPGSLALAIGRAGYPSALIWNPANGPAYPSMAVNDGPVNAVAWSPVEDRQLAIAVGPEVHFSNPSANGVTQLAGHTGDVTAIAFSPDGARIATGAADDTVRLWDMTTGGQLYSVPGDVTALRFSPDGKTLAVQEAGRIRLLAAEDGSELRRIDGPTGTGDAISFSPDGATLLAGGENIRLIETRSGQVLRSFGAQDLAEQDPLLTVALAHAPDGKTLAVLAGDNTVQLWDPAAGRLLATAAGYGEEIASVAFAPDGNTLVATTLDGAVRLWDVAAGSESRAWRSNPYLAQTAAFSPDGALLAIGQLGGTRVWDTATWSEKFAMAGPGINTEVLAFSPDGKSLATAGNRNGSVHVREAATGEVLTTLSSHSGRVNALAFSPDSRLLATASDDKTVKIWRPDNTIELATLAGHAAAVRAVAFSPDGLTLAGAGDDGTVRLWDVSFGRELAVLDTHAGPVQAVAFAPGGDVLATAGDDRVIRLWDVATHREIVALPGHTAAITTLAFNRAGTLLASGSLDGTIRLWGETWH